MDAENQGEVIFRLPGAQHFTTLEPGIGEYFIIQPFLKRSKQVKLQGIFKEISEEETENCLASWKLKTYVKSDSLTDSSFLEIVGKAVEAIKANEFTKVVIARQNFIETDCKLYPLFLNLCRDNPQAFVYVFTMEGHTMIGASPEILLVKQEDNLKTEALGGTLTNGKYSEKERVEHAHIKTYIETILEHFAYAYYTRETTPRRAGNVEHLNSGYSIISQGNILDLELSEAMHPTAAVCGLPYRESLAFIEKEEGFDRSYYSGYLGPVFKNHLFNFYVNLRCADVFSNGFLLYAGAGINGMSVAIDEFEETESKMQTIAKYI